MTADLEDVHYSDVIAQAWEARRNFSTYFGLRITYDTKASSGPFMQVWHDYKSGEFLMRLEGDAHFRMLLNAQFAVTAGTLPADVFQELSRQPVRIEHTSHTNKWTAYQTDGLPEAIAAAIADLETAKQRLAKKECRA